MTRAAFLVPLSFIAAGLVLWELLVRGLQVAPYLLPAPTAILATVDTALLRHLLVTLAEAASGFAIASVLAFAAALLFAHSPTIERGLFPIAITLKTTPLVAIAPLLVLWMGTGWASKIAAAALISFFPVLVNTVRGLKAPDPEYFELFRSMHASAWQEFTNLRIPYCLPYLMSALKISSSLSIVGAIVGEFVGATQGLGYLIMVSSAHLETDTLFSAIFAAALAGIALFHLLGWIERRLIYWQRLEEQ